MHVASFAQVFSSIAVEFLLIAISCFPTTAFAQHEAADKKISEIESYKKYKIDKSSDELLREINHSSRDTSIAVTELTNFSSKKGIGKIIQASRFQGTRIKRTCYFGNDTRLFAINDSVRYDNHTSRVFTYYFDNGSFSAVDENRKDATAQIDQSQIYDWLRFMFEDFQLKDWGIGN